MIRREIFNSVVEYDLPFARSSKIIEALAGKFITLCRVSSLYDASFEKEDLKELANRLEEKLVSSANIEIEGVELEALEGFPSSYPAIEIKVFSGSKYLYHGILFSVDEVSTRSSKYTSLPLLAIIRKCHKPIYEIVHGVIEDRFVCSISPFVLTEEQVKWLGAIVINETLRRKLNAGISFVHSITGVSSEITHEMSSDFLESVWAECLLTRENVLREKQVDEFFLGIWLHARRVFGCELSSYPVTSLSVMGGLIYLRNAVRMKIDHSTVLYLLLSFISTCIQANSLGYGYCQ